MHTQPAPAPRAARFRTVPRHASRLLAGILSTLPTPFSQQNNPALGILSANLINYGTGKMAEDGWRISLGVFGGLTLMVVLWTPLMPDSPDSYIARKQPAKARRALEVRAGELLRDEPALLGATEDAGAWWQQRQGSAAPGAFATPLAYASPCHACLGSTSCLPAASGAAAAAAAMQRRRLMGLLPALAQTLPCCSSCCLPAALARHPRRGPRVGGHSGGDTGKEETAGVVSIGVGESEMRCWGWCGCIAQVFGVPHALTSPMSSAASNPRRATLPRRERS